MSNDATNGVRTKPVKPGSPEWMRTISASKVPAILGISPWESRFSLWHRMKGNTPPQQETSDTSRGHYLEPAIAAWFADQHHELQVLDGASFQHHEHEEWTCTPDRLGHVLVIDSQGWTQAGEQFGVEIKSAAYADEWGKEGTAEIPPYYLAQVAWQMVVTGLRKIYVPIITGQLQFREYVVTWEDVADDIPTIIRAVEEFQKSLDNNAPPAIDESGNTYQAIRELHPDIDPETVEIPAALGAKYISAFASLTEAEMTEGALKNQIADLMGNAKKCTWSGITIFTRQARNGGIPYLVASKQLKTASIDHGAEPICEATTETRAA